MTHRIIVNGEDWTDRIARTMAFLKLGGLQNQINRRFDRCCHPGKPGDGDLFIRRIIRERNTA